jgi:hypothetical protein
MTGVAEPVTAFPVEAIFSAANTIALLCWLAIILLPRTPFLRRCIVWLAVGGFCAAYGVLIQLHFFAVPEGGFGSLASVQRLFTSPAVALAGWLHYLAFDLFVGVWIAKRADALGLSRWLQAPMLALTFMFGPIGLLVFGFVVAARRTQRQPVLEKNTI